MDAIKSERQQLIIGTLSLLFYLVTPSVANENILQQLEKEFQKVVADARPAVVKVVATQMMADPLSWDADELVLTRQDIGSGIVIDSDGHVVTTTFEMETPSKIEITFNNGKAFPAKLVGIDTLTGYCGPPTRGYPTHNHTSAAVSNRSRAAPASGTHDARV